MGACSVSQRRMAAAGNDGCVTHLDLCQTPRKITGDAMGWELG